MSRPIRHLGASFILAASLLSTAAWAQNPGRGGRAAPTRRPFAKAGTPRQAERIRYFDVKHIKAELTLDTKKREVRGTVTHTLSPLHPYLNQVELDCGPELKVTKVTVGDKAVPCTFTTKDGKLSITLDKAHGPGDTLDLAIEYSGSPEHGLNFVLNDPAYPEKPLAIWTQGESEDTHHWLPCYDYPNDRATSEMIITVEKPLFVVSNGALVETKQNAGATTTYHWKMDVPHVSYLISLAVGDFAVYHDKVGDLPVDYYVAKHVDEATARRFMGKTPADDPLLWRDDRPAVSLCQVRPDLPPRVRRRDGEHLGHLDDRQSRCGTRSRRSRGTPTAWSRTSWRTSGSATS